MATNKIVDADKLDADLTSIADTIRTRSGFSGTIDFPDGFKAGVDNVYAFANESGYTTGVSVGYDEGYSVGYHEGDQNGYSEGYDDGYEEGAKNSFTPPTSDVLDPEEVYRTTRPSDWLPLPTPNDYECYCLGHILPNANSCFAAHVTFTGTCTLAFGNLVNGVFVAKETHNLTSGTRFIAYIPYDDYGDDLPNGNRQYIARIYGTNISKIGFTRGGKANTPSPYIVDICCGINLQEFNGGDYNNERSGLYLLEYLRFVGNGGIKWVSAAFVGGCDSLKCVSIPNEIPCDNASWGYANYGFYGCRNLVAVSASAWGQMINSLENAFRHTCIQTLRTSAPPKSIPWAFADSRLTHFDKDTVNTKNTTNMERAFSQCYSLVSVTDLDITALTNVTDAFFYCYSLQRLTFAGETTPGGYTINLQYSTLGHEALVEMINSLPTATAAATINITSNPGASELTDAEIAIASAKNWTITR